jgi:hypothetical protein
VFRYVNEIAAIVHSNVSSMDGSPNKNIGDAFLLVWRLPAPHFMDADDLFQMNEHQPRLMRPQLQQVRRRATLAAAAAAATEANNQQQQLRRRRRRQRSPHSDDDDHSDTSSEDAEADVDVDAALSDDLTPSPAPSGVLVEQALELEEEAKEAHESLLDRAKKAGASIPPVMRLLNPNVRQQVSVLADKALVSFLRIIVEIHASEEVKKFANHPRIKEAFRDFEVQLGFGLHCGWAIEGPIGRSVRENRDCVRARAACQAETACSISLTGAPRNSLRNATLLPVPCPLVLFAVATRSTRPTCPRT